MKQFFNRLIGVSKINPDDPVYARTHDLTFPKANYRFPALAGNPYMEFQARPAENGEFEIYRLAKWEGPGTGIVEAPTPERLKGSFTRDEALDILARLEDVGIKESSGIFGNLMIPNHHSHIRNQLADQYQKTFFRKVPVERLARTLGDSYATIDTNKFFQAHLT